MPEPSALKITKIHFQRISQPRGTHIGFVDLIFNDQLRVNDISIHNLPNPHRGDVVRLRYPEKKGFQRVMFHPTKPEVTRYIEKAVNEHVLDALGEEYFR